MTFMIMLMFRTSPQEEKEPPPHAYYQQAIPISLFIKQFIPFFPSLLQSSPLTFLRPQQGRFLMAVLLPLL